MWRSRMNTTEKFLIDTMEKAVDVLLTIRCSIYDEQDLEESILDVVMDLIAAIQQVTGEE